MPQRAKNLPAMQETQIQVLGQEDSLEKGMATHFSILLGELHGQRAWLQSMGPQSQTRLSN